MVIYYVQYTVCDFLLNKEFGSKGFITTETVPKRLVRLGGEGGTGQGYRARQVLARTRAS